MLVILTPHLLTIYHLSLPTLTLILCFPEEDLEEKWIVRFAPSRPSPSFSHLLPLALLQLQLHYRLLYIAIQSF
jgi:hypothetical protein